MTAEEEHSRRRARRWQLIDQLQARRELIHGGVCEVWRRFAAPRTAAQQREILTVIQLALSQLAECERIETTLL